ncbi:hypothetical protein MTR67_018612 [Solanum verrucosum]|uniref:Uncharacterized protein n=1 Tax=Solanum verrucosum TaxID=315347 RepID=A0AAF0QJZ9_SOLVR|nr:hypothetical protein MTR67_018612 [Solanum verrucosum]
MGRQMAVIWPKIPVCQALKEKIKSAMEWSSRRVAERFRDAVLDHPKLLISKAYHPLGEANEVQTPQCGYPGLPPPELGTKFHSIIFRVVTVTEREDVEGQSKKAMELTKGWIVKWIGDPDLLRRMVLHNIFLVTINTFLNS